MIFKGFRFGFILQLAIGPVCLFIFKLANNSGFIITEIAVLAVALVDAFYILLAILGVAPFIQTEKAMRVFSLFGAVIVALFGANIVFEVLGGDIWPGIKMVNIFNADNSFLTGLFLTASNPLTIIFWAGLFTAKINEERLGKTDLALFGGGAVLSTLVFLTAVTLVGCLTHQFLPVGIIKLFNLAVGLVLIFFALKLGIKRPGNQVLNR